MFHGRLVLLGLAAVAAVSIQALGLRSTSTRHKRMVYPQLRVPNTCPDGVPPASSRVDENAQRQLLNSLSAITSGEVTADRRKLAVRSAARFVTNRALFFTLTNRMLSGFRNFMEEPGFLYYYTSSATAVSAGSPLVVGSGIFFDTNSSYPNWFRNMAFNQTFTRFAPRALRQSTSRLRVVDYGGDVSLDYTLPTDRNDDYYSHMNRDVEIQRINRRSEVSTLRVTVASEASTPRTGNPVFECGANLNRWTVPLYSPVVDIMARYTLHTYLQRPKYVAVATADLDVGRLGEDLPGSSVPASERMLQVMPSCSSRPASPGNLPPRFFEALYPQSRLALRLAHSLSAFLQLNQSIVTSGVSEPFDWRSVDWRKYNSTHPPPMPPASTRIDVEETLNHTLLEAEVLANVLADETIAASGIFYEVEGYADGESATSTLPKAFQATQTGPAVSVKDLSDSTDYLSSPLMREARADWQTGGMTVGSLDAFRIHARIRTNIKGEGVHPYCPTPQERTCSGLVDYGLNPLIYKAPRLEQGFWTSPQYLCDGNSSGWVVTYAAPFFGPSTVDPFSLILRGIVTVNITITDENWHV